MLVYHPLIAFHLGGDTNVNSVSLVPERFSKELKYIDVMDGIWASGASKNQR